MTTTVVPQFCSQDEMRAELDNDRKVREQRSTTFKDFASGFANENRGGRFAKSDSGPTIQPLPPGSPWSGQQPRPGIEPPLGYDQISVSGSGATAPDPPSVDETALDRGGSESSPPAPLLSSRE